MRPWRVVAVVPSLSSHSAIPIWDVQLEPAFETWNRRIMTLPLSSVDLYPPDLEDFPCAPV